MLITLLRHQWLRAIRSSSRGRGCVTTVVLVFTGFVIFSQLLSFAFYMDRVVQEATGRSDTVAVVNRFLIYYYFFEIITRLIMQKLPAMDIDAYRNHPIKTPTLIHYVLGTSYFTPFTFIVPILFTPFALTVVGAQTSDTGAWAWLLTLIILSWAIHIGLIWIRRMSGPDYRIPAAAAAILIPVVLLDYFGWIAIGEYAAPFFERAAHQPYPLMIVLAGFVLLYRQTFRLYERNRYQDEFSGSDRFAGGKTSFDFLDNFGATGELINQEIKLIIRHKRARASVVLCLVFLFYGLLFYPDMDIGTNSAAFLMIFVGVFVTGVFNMQYGQFLLSWNSGYFDFFITNPVSFRDYVASKFYLMACVSGICYLLALPYVYFGWEVLVVNTAMVFYNVGVNSYIIIFLAMWEPQKIDLNQKSAFSFQGVGAAQWVMALPLFLGPIMLFIPFAILDLRLQGILFIGLLGILGILFQKTLIALCSRRLVRLKYDITSSFRSE